MKEYFFMGIKRLRGILNNKINIKSALHAVKIATAASGSADKNFSDFHKKHIWMRVCNHLCVCACAVRP